MKIKIKYLQNISALKEERKRKREEKAVLKRSREDARSARFELANSGTKKMELIPKHEHSGMIKSEPMGSVPNSPTSSNDTGSSPSSSPGPIHTGPIPVPFSRSVSYPGVKHEPYDMDSCAKRARISPDVLAGPVVFSCQTKVRLTGNKPGINRSLSADHAVRVPVITSFDQFCTCGCKKVNHPGFNRSFSTGNYLQRKNSLADSPMSSPQSLDDEDEFINVDS